MDLTPTLTTGASEAPAVSSPAEPVAATSQEATTSAPSGETQTTQAEATEQAAAPSDGKTSDAAAETGETAPAEGEAKDSDDGRFDKHPRWKQMVTQRNEAKKQAEVLALEKAKLEGRLSALEAVAQPKQQQERGIDFDAELANIDAQLDSGKIDLMQARAMERKLNRAMLQQELSAMHSHVVGELTAKQRAEAEKAQAMGLTEQFYKANPDFETLCESGELDAIRQQDPLHDDVSAFYALKLQKAEAAKQADVETAVKAAEERIRREVAAKQSARTMTSSTSASPTIATGADRELSEPEKFGGLNAVLASRLRARRAASA